MTFQFSHEELAALIEGKFPGMRQWVNFWVCHPVKQNSAEQIGEAFIAAWDNENIPEPSMEELVALKGN